MVKFVTVSGSTKRPTAKRTPKNPSRILETKPQAIAFEILFNICKGCSTKKRNMSSIPQGMFAAMKTRENREKLTVARMINGENCRSPKYFSTKLTELTPLKYNSKLMNSIWGLYNRYSPHNIKSTIDEIKVASGDLQQSAATLQKNASVKEAPDGSNKTCAKQHQNVPKLENFWASVPISH